MEQDIWDVWRLPLGLFSGEGLEFNTFASRVDGRFWITCEITSKFLPLTLKTALSLSPPGPVRWRFAAGSIK